MLAVLGTTYVLADDLEVTARQHMYADPIVHAETTPYQDIVITRSTAFTGSPDIRLFLNGDLQFSSVDEYRYHESLVHPALSGRRSNVLIMGVVTGSRCARCSGTRTSGTSPWSNWTRP
ncbi:hypothetical protein LV779_34810 [Streptomyces thinghirensis]|nr:hypothetical protein [Streptomyces thinghirensis]